MEIPTDSIVKFLEKSRTATRNHSKEIRLTIDEAQDLALNISQLQTYHIKLLEKIRDLEDKLRSMPITVTMSGGTFK